MLRPEQKTLLINVSDFKRGSVDHINRELVVASDVTADSAKQTEITLHKLLGLQFDNSDFDAGVDLLKKLTHTQEELRQETELIDELIKKYNPHIDEVRI